MPKKELLLDTPFRRGEKVVTTRDVFDIPAGTPGKVQIHNGLGIWNRYWVIFDDDRQVGQVDHNDLVRPDQIEAWLQREQDKADADARSESEAAAAAETAADASGGGGRGGIADQIPAQLLERSRAAKQRLLG